MSGDTCELADTTLVGRGRGWGWGGDAYLFYGTYTITSGSWPLRAT